MSELDDLKRDAAELERALRGTVDAFRAASASAGELSHESQSLHTGLGDLARGFNEVDEFATRWAGRARAVLESAAAYETHVRAVTSLGAAYGAVRAATNDTVTAEQALRAQQTLTQSGLRVSSDELGSLTRRAREYALATGTETVQALDQLVDALRGGESEGLRRFGIAVRQGETDVQVFHRALREMGDQFRHDAPAARTMAEELSLLNTNTTNLGGSLAALAANAFGLGGAIRALNELLHDTAEVADHLGRGDRSREQGERTQDARARANRTLNSSRVRLLTGGRSLGIGNINQYSEAQANQITAALDRLGRDTPIGEDVDLSEVQRLAGGFREANAPPVAAPERQGRVVGGGGGGASPLLAIKARLTEAQRDANARGVPIYNDRPTPGETLSHYWSRLTESQRQLNQLFPEVNRMDDVATASGVRSPGDLTGMFTDLMNAGNGPSRDQMRAGGIARGQQLDRDPGFRFGEARDRELRLASPNDMGAQMEMGLRSFANTADRTQTVAQTMAGAVTDSFHQMTQAAVGFVSAIASGADPAEALRQQLHSLGEALLQKAGMRALEAGLEGTFRLATSYGADPSGWALLGNAAAWGAVALVGGVTAAATAPPRPQTAAGVGPGGSPSLPRINSPGGSDARASGPSIININIDGHMITDRRTTEWLVAQSREADRRGLNRT